MLPLLTLTLLAAPAAAQTSPAQTGTGPCAGQIVRDATGDVCVPKAPKRIVTIDWAYSEDLLALGLQPVGMADIKGFVQYVKTPVPVAASVKELGQRDAVSLEALAALKPDLIIDAQGVNKREQFSKIAPTLMFNPYPKSGITAYQDMRRTFALIGKVTGRSEQARAVLAALDADAARARQTLAASGRSGQTFVLSQGYTYNTPTMRLFGPRSMGSQILEQIGLRNAYRSSVPEYGFDTLSLEGLTTLKTQNFFGITASDDNIFTASGNQALWNALPFVKQGRGYALSPDTWLFGGPSSARTLMAQVVTVMTAKR